MPNIRPRRDLLFNFIGRGWMGLLAVLAMPIYIKLLKIEAYGLIGFYLGLCAIFSIMDFGLGEIYCRESARMFAKGSSTNPSSLRTLEILFWVLGAIICYSSILLAPWISKVWIQDHTLYSQERLCFLLRLMFVALFFLWPQIFYTKGLQGLQSHLANNLILFWGVTLRHVGGIVLLYRMPKIEIFFYWQIFCACFQTGMALFFTWHKLSQFHVPFSFSFKAFASVWKFGLGMSGFAITSVLLQQADKFFVSHFFSLEDFGIYCVACSVASSLYYFAHPIGTYYYPLFIQYVETRNWSALKSAYSAAYKLMFGLLIPISMLVLLFGKKILHLWTTDSHLAEVCAPLLSWMVLGIMLNCFNSITFYIQFAFGYTRTLLYQNTCALILVLPLCMLLAHFFGVTGIAFIYFFLNLGYLVFNVPLIRNKLLIRHG